MNTMDNAALERLTDVAREYCDFIERFEGLDAQESTRFLANLSRMLPRLHAAVAALGDVEGFHAFVDDDDLDKRFELYSRLHDALGELDAYWMEFDVARDSQEKSGSLADDLTDIYWELKKGLRRLQQRADTRGTLRCWGAGYRLNWGQHLVDAERHLYALRARRMV